MATTAMVGLFPVVSGSTASWAVLLLLVALTARSRVPELQDAVVLALALYIFALMPGLNIWPLPAGAALVVAAGFAVARGRWPVWRTWLRTGHIDARSWVLMVVVVVVTVAALLVWQHLFDRELPATYAGLVEGRPVWQVAGAGAAFLLVNSFIEDSIFSGLLLTLLDKFFPRWVAVLVAAAFFGVLHLQGVPDGWIGVVMAGLWAVLLAALRHRTGGLVATYLAHAAADATIVAMLLPSVMN